MLYFQDFNTLKEEFNEKFLNEDNDYNGYNNKPLDMGSNEAVQQLKVSYSFTLGLFLNFNVSKN